MDAEFIQTPYFADHAKDDYEDKFTYYLSDLKKIQPLLNEKLLNKSIVCDRYLHSTVAYQTNLHDVEPLFERYNLLVPDVSILLTIEDNNVRLKRLENRKSEGGIITDLDYESEKLKNINERFKRMSGLYTIDTTNKDIETVWQEMQVIL
ncbi:thymidylate kinase [Wohlfahrtiimonas chitiniclastica]|nr:thymidylate kinase [Wohlfahrtiimonas chitiniclastica]